MLRRALTSLVLAFTLACGPVAPAPDGATAAPASTSTADAATSTGGHNSSAPTSTGADASTGGSSTGELCSPWPCALGCPSGYACDGQVCADFDTSEPLCAPEPCSAPCSDPSDCGAFACILGFCLPPSGAPFCPSACDPLPCGDGCPAASKCVAVGGAEFCVEPTTSKPLCTSDGPCVDANGTVTCV